MTAPPDLLPHLLKRSVDSTFAAVQQALHAFRPELVPHEVGVVKSVSLGIAQISGLPGVGYE